MPRSSCTVKTRLRSTLFKLYNNNWHLSYYSRTQWIFMCMLPSEARNMEWSMHVYVNARTRRLNHSAFLSELCLQHVLRNALNTYTVLHCHETLEFASRPLLFLLETEQRFSMGELIAWHEGILFISCWSTGWPDYPVARLINIGLHKKYPIWKGICIIKLKNKNYL